MKPENNINLERRKIRWIILQFYTLIDLLVTICAFAIAYNIRKYLFSGTFADLLYPYYYIVFLLIAIIWFASFRLVHIYDNFSEKKKSKIISEAVKSVSLSIIILTGALYLLKITHVSRILLGFFYILNIGFLISVKFFILSVVKKRKNKDYNFYNVLIVGSKKRAEGVISIINQSPIKYNIIGCLEIAKKRVGQEVVDGIKVIGTMDDIQKIILNEVVDEVIFAMPIKMIKHIDAYIFLLETVGKNVRIFPDWQIHSILYDPQVATALYDEFNGIPSLLLRTTKTRQNDLLIKHTIDYCFSAIGFILLLPFFLIVGILIKLCSKGPVFFKQERVGLNGRKFGLYKFRTMVQNAEEKLAELKALNEADGPVFKIKKDPRIIPVIGTFLRKTSLDELPQLINVLKGEISLVGPRPPIQSEVDQYNPWQRRRLSMKPGITCIWQIQPNRNDLSFNQWMNMDLYYIDNWKLSLDFSLLWKTVLVVFGAQGR